MFYILGIEMDTDQLKLFLPLDKLQRVKQMVNDWMGCKAARRRELESLLGLLQHAVKEMSQGSRFVRRIHRCQRKRSLHQAWAYRYIQDYCGGTGSFLSGIG